MVNARIISVMPTKTVVRRAAFQNDLKTLSITLIVFIDKIQTDDVLCKFKHDSNSVQTCTIQKSLVTKTKADENNYGGK